MGRGKPGKRGRSNFKGGKHQQKGKFSKFSKKSKKNISLGKIRNDLQEKKHYNRNDYGANKKPNLNEPPSKRVKFQNKAPELPQESSSESEEEVEDALKQLLCTFKTDLTQKANEAIDSESDEEEEEEEKCEEEEELIHSDTSEHESDNESLLEDEHDEDLDVETEIVEEADIEDKSDPFLNHIAFDLSSSLLEAVQKVPTSIENVSLNWPQLGNLQVQIPKCADEELVKKSLILEEQQFTHCGTIPSKLHSNKINCADLHIKSQISENIKSVNKACSNSAQIFTPLQLELFSIINNYQDLYYGDRTFSNGEELRFMYTLHAVNHIIKTRTKIVHHNSKLSKKDDVPDDFRDQGLVRPKVLILVPFRDSALKIVQMMIDLLLPKNKDLVLNKKRFMEEFSGQEISMPKKNPKPEDYEQTFSGNSTDDFKIGLSITKKSLKLYADFYSSDIIIASPLGLRLIIGAEGEQDRNYDFLASLELLILDQTEIFIMQNWDHVLHCLQHMHLQPKDSHGTDFSRVRNWALNGWSKYYRQTLLFSSYCLPEFNAIFNKKCFNYAGKVKVVNAIASGTISQVVVQLPHVFQKVDASTVLQAIDARFEFFVGKVLPQHKDALMKQTLIYVPNYFDYVKLRNYFKKEDIGFVQICEYSKESKIARARDMFFHGDAHFLLYTERYHFYNRQRIKGIRHLIFYQPPTCPNFYYEICNLLQEGYMNKKCGNMSNMSVTVLYTKYDVQQISAIAGTERATKMLQSDRSVHMFVTDGLEQNKNI